VRRIILHGGAGSWRESPIRFKSMEAVKNCALHGKTVLEKTNNAVEAVVEAVKCMEDSGYLNAGVGSVLDLAGGRSLDAGLMSSTGLIGAVAAVKKIRNPIVLAKYVAENTPHIILAGESADELGLMIGIPPLPPPPRHVYERYREGVRKILGGEVKDGYYERIASLIERIKYLRETVSNPFTPGDTVGAVAVDDNGVLAAATSTGGVSLKLPGRVGDTPIPGAGFYSGVHTACSATGYGEVIIREMPCRRLDELVEKGLSLEEGATMIIKEATRRHGPGNMGFIAIDKNARVTVKYNTEAMLVSYVEEGGNIVVLDKP
jgi:beta-aspartyl-peptidase (threonine type)